MLARLAFLVLLIAPAIALAADAPPGGGKLTVVAQPPPKAAAPASAPMSPPPDAASCRMDCAQSLYICRAGEDPDGCGGGWSQCVAACNAPALAPPTSPA